MLAHEADRLGTRHAIEDSQAGEGSTGPALAARAGELHPLGHGPLQGLGQGKPHLLRICLAG